jgi:hypothetical protein
LHYLRQRATKAANGPDENPEASGRTGFEDVPIGQGELNDITERAHKIGRALLDQGVLAGDVDSVLAQIEELTRNQKDKFIPASTAQYDLALRALMELEYLLRNKFDKSEFPELLIAEPNELPDDYKEMVADYFRKLSQQ